MLSTTNDVLIDMKSIESIFIESSSFGKRELEKAIKNCDVENCIGCLENKIMIEYIEANEL